MQKLISALRRSGSLREQFLANPVGVASEFGIELTEHQRSLLSQARAFEADPLVSATMCPKSSGYEDIASSKGTRGTSRKGHSRRKS
jgi:hypothetical protein